MNRGNINIYKLLVLSIRNFNAYVEIALFSDNEIDMLYTYLRNKSSVM